MARTQQPTGLKSYTARFTGLSRNYNFFVTNTLKAGIGSGRVTGGQEEGGSEECIEETLATSPVERIPREEEEF
jgi:hypothetical protein